MTYTETYHSTVLNFRKAIRAVNEKFAPKYAALERFKDSANYAEDKAALDKARSDLLAEVRDQAAADFDRLCDEMKAAYLSRPASAPSAEQLRLLQTLQMRERLSRDELRQAKETVKDCPAALEVLRELAHKHGHTLGLQAELSGGMVQHTIDALRWNGEKLARHLEDPDDRGRYVNAGNWSMFRLTSEPVDVADTLRIFGACTAPEEFMETVNGAN